MSATTRGPLDLEIRKEILTGLMREAHREFLETRYPGIPLGDWKAGRVRRVNGQLTSVKTLKFAVKPGTFVCFDANTEQFKESRVRARDMVKGVLDNYHQSLSELREIAYYEVHNEDVGKAMQNAALLLGKGEPRSFEKVYEICPGSDGWNELRKQLYSLFIFALILKTQFLSK